MLGAWEGSAASDQPRKCLIRPNRGCCPDETQGSAFYTMVNFFMQRHDMWMQFSKLCHLRVVDGDLNLNPRLNADGGDLLDDVRGRVQVDQALVDPAHGQYIK